MLVSFERDTAPSRPGAKSERWGQVRQMRGGPVTQGDQHRSHCEVLSEREQGRGAFEKMLGHQPFQRDQHGMDSQEPTPRPAQRPGQLDIQAQPRHGAFQRVGLLHLIDDGFDPGQRAREPCSKAIGEQTERALTFRAIPARNPCAGRRDPPIGAVVALVTSLATGILVLIYSRTESAGTMV